MEEIFNFFIKNGFERDGNTLTKKETRVVRQVIVNGQQHNETREITYVVNYLGEGYVEDTKTGEKEITYGFSFAANGHSDCDVWARDIKDLISILKR